MSILSLNRKIRIFFHLNLFLFLFSFNHSPIALYTVLIIFSIITQFRSSCRMVQLLTHKFYSNTEWRKDDSQKRKIRRMEEREDEKKKICISLKDSEYNVIHTKWIKLMMWSSYIFLFIFLIISPWENLIFIAPSVDGKWQAHIVWILYMHDGYRRFRTYVVSLTLRLSLAIIPNKIFHASSLYHFYSIPLFRRPCVLTTAHFAPAKYILLTIIICIRSTFYAPQLLRQRATSTPHHPQNTTHAANNNNFTTIIIIVINFDNVYNCFNRFSNVPQLLCCYMYYHLRASRQE